MVASKTNKNLNAKKKSKNANSSTTSKKSNTKKKVTIKSEHVIVANDYKDALDKSLESLNVNDVNVEEIMDSLSQTDLNNEVKNRMKKIASSIDLDNITGEEAMNQEFKLWKIDTMVKNKNYGKFLYIISHIKDFDHRPSHNELYELCAKKYKTTPDVIRDKLKEFFNKVDFSNSKFIPILKSLNRSQITPDLVLINIIDYIY